MKPVTKGYAPWASASPWFARIDGKRRFFKTEAERDQALAEWERGDLDVRLTHREYAEWRWCKRSLPAGTSLKHVVEDFLRRHARTDWRRTVASAVEEYLALRSSDTSLRPRYLRKMRSELRHFTAALGEQPVSALTPQSIEAFCRGRGRANVQYTAQAHLSAFFGHALRQGWVAENPAERRRLQLDRLPRPTPETWTADEAERIMDVAAARHPEVQAAFAIQLYAGVRTEEIVRLKWASVRPGVCVEVPAEAAKTRERRVIDFWPANLTRRLGPPGPPDMPIAPPNYPVRKSFALKDAGVPRRHNGMRHTYASHAVAYFGDAAKTALMLGHHDQHLLFRHYRNYVTPAEGRRFFGP